MRFSSRARGVAESATLRLWAEAARLRASGVDVIGMLEGEPDLPVPEPVIRAVEAALKAGRTRYSSSTGLDELKAAVVVKLRDENGIEVLPNNIIITNGAKQALYESLQTLCDPGDEVLVPSPCWVTFPEAVKLAGAAPILIGTDNNHQLDLKALEAAVTPKTKVIVLNTPNNPTGAVYSEDSLRAVVAFAVRHELAILSDEAYEGLVYDGARHRSIASLSPEALSRTVTIQTCSKSFAMTGFRVGYLAGPADFVKAAGRVHGHVTGNVCTFAQLGAVAALDLGASHRDAWRAAHQTRRDVAFELGSKLFDCVKPRGGLFLFADARRHLKKHKDSAALAQHLLDKARVAVVPGSAFGREGFLRLSFSSPEAVLREGFSRLEEAL
ncbi:MAG TPA: pyridoxal phosphate-dependent aminotransferase [Elusimicrobiota bacterium]|jgi:aspartate aminotransferase|nr:pyridoxal phosphate-dependent aminotransferase [Elusimicrobiota bacterium]